MNELLFLRLIMFVPIIYILLFSYWILKISDIYIRAVVFLNLITCGFIAGLTGILISTYGNTAIAITENGKIIPMSLFATEQGYITIFSIVIIGFIIVNLIYIYKYVKLKKHKTIYLNKISKIHFILFPLVTMLYTYALIFKPYF